MSGYEVRSTHNASGLGWRSRHGPMTLGRLRISNMCNLLDVYKPSADTNFTQSVDELVVSPRKGNHHLPPASVGSSLHDTRMPDVGNSVLRDN